VKTASIRHEFCAVNRPKWTFSLRRSSCTAECCCSAEYFDPSVSRLEGQNPPESALDGRDFLDIARRGRTTSFEISAVFVQESHQLCIRLGDALCSDRMSFGHVGHKWMRRNKGELERDAIFSPIPSPQERRDIQFTRYLASGAHQRFLRIGKSIGTSFMPDR
jgi:hypothetical protein